MKITKEEKNKKYISHKRGNPKRNKEKMKNDKTF